ncbi:phosphate ABC transporter permease PstA [Nocardioides lianchengensis]|uniref:Phosphate transport system permease protein PstA n=1 Tax=Nocardioides lianchengensis TaxID=1045774 RepID=A0A1G6XSA7_9ACTN|nr:phosphate ABC transporter permease PstA [Nocardioides lianchengensis]NYG13408.1 phosphate transport system permease protein [Nocardioides lianchengensis]SDD80851.1 phosphate transport system permease protein [Nocardioides lianchengensis]
MTALDTRPERPETRLSKPRLPQWAPLLVLAVAAALGALAWLIGANTALSVLVAVVAYLVVMPVWSGVVESRRAAIDRLATGLVWSAFLVALVPLVWLIVTVVSNGISTINPEFLTYDMRGVLGNEQGGLYHALIGTLLITGLAALISVPVGILAAVYLVEYGAKSRMARILTFLVDVMTGIPSIVAGLFALSLFVLIFGPAVRLGFGGSVALSLLMIPTVVRSTEEMLRLVPDDLREASYALGVPKWRTILKVVVPTCVGGIVTGVVLAISRVIGETAPLLVVAGFTSSVNMNPFDGRMMTLPVFIYTQYTASTAQGLSYAWGGALVLIVIVMALNIVARIIGKIFAPKTGR